jgi:hypothetical protein
VICIRFHSRKVSSIDTLCKQKRKRAVGLAALTILIGTGAAGEGVWGGGGAGGGLNAETA